MGIFVRMMRIHVKLVLLSGSMLCEFVKWVVEVVMKMGIDGELWN